jgi:hypothetical protein
MGKVTPERPRKGPGLSGQPREGYSRNLLTEFAFNGISYDYRWDCLKFGEISYEYRREG